MANFNSLKKELLEIKEEMEQETISYFDTIHLNQQEYQNLISKIKRGGNNYEVVGKATKDGKEIMKISGDEDSLTFVKGNVGEDKYITTNDKEVKKVALKEEMEKVPSPDEE